MARVKFTDTIRIRGINPYILVSLKQAALLQREWKRPMPVLVQINGKPEKPWRVNMMPAGNGDFYLYLHGEVRKASVTKVGDTVSVEISFDTDYRSEPQSMPEWFAESLATQPTAKINWEKLSPSRQKEVLRYLTNLKSSEARDRNLKRVMGVLSGENERFMARSWNKGS